jgi:DNA-directed RNA polymerase subunit RPC12/RpoP
MEYICKDSECKHIFRPHRFLAFRHPNRVRCPECDSRCTMTEKGRDVFKDMHFEINKSRL